MPRALSVIALASLILLGGSVAHAQTPTATVDRELIAPGETVQLTVAVETGGRVRFGVPSGGDFAVVRQSTSTNATMINGRMSTVHARIYTLRPNSTGNLNVGPVQVNVDGTVYETPPIPVRVDQAAVAAAEAVAMAPVRPSRGSGVPDDEPVPISEGIPVSPAPQSPYMYDSGIPRIDLGEPFITTRVSAVDPVVGEFFVVDYVLYSPRSALDVDLTDLTEPEFEDVWFREVTQSRRDYFGGRWGTTERVGSELYEAQIFRTYVLVPLEPGTLELPPIGLELLMRGFFRDSGSRQLQSQPLLLEVREPPEPQPDGFRPGNVGRLEFRAEVDRESARVGDAVTLSLRANGVAHMASVQLPELTSLAGARVFDPDDDSDERYGRTGWLEGHVERRITIVPEQEGVLRIPALSFTWYDPFLNDYVTESTEPFEITVEGVRENATIGGEEQDTTWMEPLPALRPLSSTPQLAPPTPRGLSFWLALCVAPLMVIGILLRDQVSARRAAGAPQRRRRSAGTEALARLQGIHTDAGDAPRDILRIVHDYLELRVDRATRGLRQKELLDVLEGHLGASMASELVEILDAVAAARYAGIGALDGALRDAREWIRRAEDEWGTDA